MSPVEPFVDIHCHLLPGVDDGAASWEDALAMARIAVAEGIRTVVCTPHQLGNFSKNHGPDLRRRVNDLQQFLRRHRLPLRVLPGADVRIEAEMAEGLRRGEVLSLADRRRHVLLELPHEIYFPLEPVLDALDRLGMVGILSHPERNKGLLAESHLVETLVEDGCLMQVTAGSLTGGFGPDSQDMAQWMVEEGLTHFIATDAHSPRTRRPLIRTAFEQVCALADQQTALELCCRFPAAVAAGEEAPHGRRKRRRQAFFSWLPWARSA